MTLSPDGPLARPRRPDDEGVGLVPAGEVPGEGDGHHGLGRGVGQQTGQQALGKHDFWKHWTFKYKVVSGCAKEKSIDRVSSLLSKGTIQVCKRKFRFGFGAMYDWCGVYSLAGVRSKYRQPPQHLDQSEAVGHIEWPIAVQLTWNNFHHH